MAGMILTTKQPIYPPIARAAHVSGAVILHAIGGKDGFVDNLQVISGPRMLQASAIDAVRQWRWKPYLLNGQPVAVDTTVTVNFNITDPAPDQAATHANGTQGAPVKVAASVFSANILEKPEPICAPEHKGDPLSGTVVLDAIIARDGSVANLSVLSGPEALRGCVLDAVSQWKYHPYLLNGEPVEAETTITVDFNTKESQLNSAPVRVSGGVMAGRILTRVQPIYPPVARTQHVSGAMVAAVVIGVDGHIKTAKVISGPEMLRESFLDAIKQWTYKPYLINGVPVETQTTITITQSFGGI